MRGDLTAVQRAAELRQRIEDELEGGGVPHPELSGDLGAEPVPAADAAATT